MESLSLLDESVVDWSEVLSGALCGLLLPLLELLESELDEVMEYYLSDFSLLSIFVVES